MVAALGLAPIYPAALSLAESASRAALPPPTRAAVLMALIGIGLLGMLIVVIILLGGHWVRRQGAFRRASVVPHDRKPIVPRDTNPEAPPAAAPLADDSTSLAETVISRTTRSGENKPR